jgi:hypothetical protein
MGTLAGTARSRAHGGALSRSLHALIDGPKSTAEGRHGIATHHNASTKAVWLRPTSISSGQPSPASTIQGSEEGAKTGKKRRKQRHQEAATNVDSGINEWASGSSAKHAAEATGDNKR